MQPIYKFELSANGNTQQAFPIWNVNTSKDFEKESGEQFFRAKLSGKLTFQRDDYSLIVSAAFDTEFSLEIFISYDGGQTWSSYWTGKFWKTDCEFDADAGTVVVSPSVSDRYSDILAGMEKEFNLIELAPEIVSVKADKRPMIQVYVPGQSVIGCFLSGMWWEQECEPESDPAVLAATGDGQLNFSLNKTQRVVDVLEMGSITIPDAFTGAAVEQTTEYEFVNGAYKFKYVVGAGSYSWQIVRVSDDTILWFTNQNTVPALPYELTLQPNTGAGVSGNVKIYIHDFAVYARYITNVDEIDPNNPTFELPEDDIVPNNRNYKRVIGYYSPDSISFSSQVTETPNQWGLYKPGYYYQPPYSMIGSEFFPVARNAWGRVSVWFSFYAFDWIIEQSARQPFELRDVYPLSSVISVLLAKIAPGVTHAATTDYSEFLYGTNILGVNQTLMITPKSNVISAGYDQPAQKAPITLKDVTDMLRDCFRCYWFIDDDNRFRIEHISYFMNGGAYPGTPDYPVVGIDLTKEIVTRNGKSWAFARDQYKFDKPEMASRYQFGWMDDVTQLFEGYPIEILSKYVNSEYIEQIQIAKFTSDIDYILLNPNDISKDGFVLLAAILESGEYVLPYLNYQIGINNHYLQNAYVAFVYLQDYYAFDMPAFEYEINGESKIAIGTKKLKNQSLRFPALYDPDLFELIKTNLGDGVIEKLSINLSSRNANVTLKYDTE